MFVADAVHNSRDSIALRSNARTHVFAWAYVMSLACLLAITLGKLANLCVSSFSHP